MNSHIPVFKNNSSSIFRFNMNPRLFSLFISILFFIVFICLFYPMFESNDDNLMISILNGSTGTPSPFGTYLNLLLAHLIASIQELFPAVCWYTLLQYSVCFISLTSINFCLYRTFESSNIRWLVLLLINLWGGYECYIYPQFTKTAGICTVAGFLLINTFFNIPDHQRSDLFTGGLLMIVGSLFRFSCFGMVCIVVSSIGLIACIKLILKKNIRKFSSYILTFCIVILGALALHVVPNRIISTPNSWKEYNEINSLRSQLLDFGFPDYETNQALYSKLNISPEDLELFQNWNFADTKVFNPQAMEQLVDAKSNKVENEAHPSFLNCMIQIITANAGDYIFLLLVIILIVCLHSPKNTTALLCVASYCAVEYHLIDSGRFGLRRIEFPLTFCLAQSLLYSYSSYGNCKHLRQNWHKASSNTILLNSLLAAVTLAVALFFGYFNDIQANKDIQHTNESLFEYIADNKQSLFLFETYTYCDVWTKSYGVFSNPPSGINSNCYVLGGWTYRMPLTDSVLNSYNVTNAFQDMVDNPNIYYISNISSNDDTVVKYIRRHYAPSAEAILVKSIGNNHIYRVVTTSNN